MGGMREYWDRMSKEERSAEMKRRQAMRKVKLARQFSPQGLEAIREAQRARWRRAKRQARAGSTDSPFPESSEPNPQSIRTRLEAIETALEQLKKEIGF